MTNDMTSGKPAKLILTFSIPMLLGNIFQQFYSMADTIIVGRTIGVGALAAVGATGAIAFLILGFVEGMSGGFTVITAQRFGANDEEGVRRSVATSILLSFGVVVISTLGAVLAARPLLLFMNTPPDIIDMAYQYIVVIFGGISACVFYNLISSMIRALGDSKTPLIFLVIASVINVVLDLAFILWFHMGVAGAAYATVIAQAISGFLCLIYVAKRYPILHLHRSDWKFDWGFARDHLRVGIPMALQFSVTAIGIMVLQGALNSFGTETVASFTAASKIEQLVTGPLGAVGVAIATYSAQNYGAGKPERVRAGVRSVTLILLGFSAAAAMLAVCFGTDLISVFISGVTPTVLERSQLYLNCISGFFFFLGMLLVFRNVLQGIGRGLMPLIAGIIELVMRTACVALFAGSFGYISVCFASPAAWIGAMLPLLVTYLIIMRQMAGKKEGSFPQRPV